MIDRDASDADPRARRMMRFLFWGNVSAALLTLGYLVGLVWLASRFLRNEDPVTGLFLVGWLAAGAVGVTFGIKKFRQLKGEGIVDPESS